MDDDPRDVIEIIDYDPEWPCMYMEESVSLAKCLAHFHPHFEHIGSTAVPGLCAKPIIDIMAGVSQLQDADVYAPSLEPLGYRHAVQDDEAERVFFQKGMPRTHHLHIVSFGSEVWHRHLSFRELLKEDADLRERYAQLKRESATEHRTDRAAYVSSKNGFIQNAMAKRK